MDNTASYMKTKAKKPENEQNYNNFPKHVF